MPLGAKDILLVIRATDQASTTIARVAGSFGTLSSAQAAAATNMMRHGVGLTILGAGLIAVGKQGFDALKSWADAAMDYNHQASLTLTQIDDLGVSLEDVKNIGREVAMEIPAPFEQMQESLFDIFSSMDVNTKQAQTLLTAFAKAAVAGQTDIQTAARGSIAVMNAFKIPIEDVGKVMDTQFNLVQEGVGTYEEFANVLGRVAPSAVNLGQTFEATAGALAFLTRNGLNTEMAAASLGRAMDALAKVKVQERLEGMGVATRNAQGDFLPLVDIIGGMNEKFKDLTKPERAEALENLFKGAGGTIQARRFFNTVFDNFDEFQSLTTQMGESAGSMEGAYNKMFDSPQTKMQAFKNKLDVIRTQLGDNLLPVITKVLEAGIRLADWFENLDAGVKKNIVIFIGFASAAFMIVGAVFATIGVFLILKATLALAAVSFAAVGLAAIGIIVVIAAIAAIGYLIYRNWDTLGPIFKQAFETLKEWAGIAWAKIQEFAAWVMTWLPGVWENVQQKAKTAWEIIQAGAQLAWMVIQAVVGWLVANVPPAFEKVKEVAGNVWQFIQEKAAAFFGWLQENVFPVLEAFVGMVQAFVDRVMTIWNWLFENLGPPVAFALDFITTILGPVVDFWVAVFQNFWSIIMAIWPPLWAMVSEVVSVVWNFIKQTIESALQIIMGIFNFFKALFSGDWAGMWDAIKQIVDGAWQWIRNIVNTAFDLLFAIIRGAMNIIWQVMQAGWDNVVSFATSFPGKVWNAVAALIDLLWDLGTKALRNLLDATKNGAGEVVGFMLGLPGKIGDALSGLAGKLFSLGKDAIQGLLNGIKSLASAVADKAKDIANSVKDAVGGALSMNSPSLVMDLLGKQAFQGFINGMHRMGPAVEREVTRMASKLSDADLSVPVGWSPSALSAGGGSAANPFAGSTFDIDININGTDLSAEEVGEITKQKLEEALKELYRELLTGVRQ